MKRLVSRRSSANVDHFLVIIHLAIDDHFTTLKMPVHGAREPKAVIRPLAFKPVIEFPHRADKTKADVHCLGQMHIGFHEAVIRFVHPDATSGLVDETIFEIPLWHFFIHRNKINRQCRAAVDPFASGQCELKTTGQIRVKQKIIPL